MSEGSGCCCGGDGPCFYGWSTVEDDWSNCGHTFEEELFLRRPRPAWSTRGVAYWDNCEICGNQESGNWGEFEYGTYQAGTWDIVVRYEHFNFPNPDDLYTWYYEPADPSMNPPCQGQVTVDCHALYQDRQCCEQTDQDPFMCGDHDYWEVNASVYNTIRRRMGNMQRKIVQGDIIAPNPGTSPIVTIDWDTNDAFRWLDGVANAPQHELYEHWAYDQNYGDVVSVGRRTLVECLTVVLHREKWYSRYANNLRQEENPDSTIEGVPASCATPGYFAFGCTGIPVYSFEFIGALGADAGAAAILEVKHGRPLSSVVIEALQQYGALDLGDFEREDGRCIRKTFNPTNEFGYPIYETPQTRYFYGRYGGWSHICHDILPIGGDFANFPQVARQHTNQCGVNVTDCMSGVPGPRGDEEVECWHNSQCASADPCGDPVTSHPRCVSQVFLTDFCHPCISTAVSMNCTGARFLYAAYGYNPKTSCDNPEPVNSNCTLKQFYCDENEAIVYRCDHLGNILRDEDGDNFPMPGSPHHATPIHATEACRRRSPTGQPWSDCFFACCGAIGGWFQEDIEGNGPICIVTRPNAGDCGDVDIGPQTKTWFL